MKMPMEIEFGNAAEVDTRGTGWFIGFSEWARDGAANLRYMPRDVEAANLCVEWFLHHAGHPNGDAKPISEGRTISMLIGLASEFRIELSLSPEFAPTQTVTYVLRKPGDFAAWGPDIYHRAFGVQQACILTVRWIPRPADRLSADTGT